MKITKFFLILCAVCMLYSVEAYAETVSVTFDSGTQDYNESLEVYLSNDDEYYCFKLGIDNGYELSQDIKEGTYVVHAFSIGDANQFYDYAINPEKLMVKEGDPGAITITLSNTFQEEYSGNDDSLPPDVAEPTVEPQLFDFSGSEEYGTLNVQCAYASGVESVTYTLRDDEGEEYPIILSADNMYEARILLPYGTYHEIGQPEVTFYKDCNVSEEYRYTWTHTDSNYYGSYYTLDSSQPASEFEDLAIVLHINGDSYISPDFWDLSITKKYYDNLVENITSIDREINADEYEDINQYLKRAGQETIPAAEPAPEIVSVEEGHDSILLTISIIFAAIMIVIVIFILRSRGKRKH